MNPGRGRGRPPREANGATADPWQVVVFEYGENLRAVFDQIEDLARSGDCQAVIRAVAVGNEQLRQGGERVGYPYLDQISA